MKRTAPVFMKCHKCRRVGIDPWLFHVHEDRIYHNACHEPAYLSPGLLYRFGWHEGYIEEYLTVNKDES